MATEVGLSATRGGEVIGSETKVSDELTRMPEEPLLGVEKKLIVYSLTLGVALMAVLVWLSYSFFNG